MLNSNQTGQEQQPLPVFICGRNISIYFTVVVFPATETFTGELILKNEGK